MNINELENLIASSNNPKKNYHNTSYNFDKDCLAIRSIIYEQYIYLNEVTSCQEFYQKISDYGLDSQILDKPFYLLLALEDFNENTLNVLNELDKNIMVLMSIPKDIGDKEIEYLKKIKNDNIYIYHKDQINQESMKYILSRFKVDLQSSPTLVLDKIDESTADFIKYCLTIFPNLKTKIEIKEANSLLYLNSILPFIPEKEIDILLDDNLFNDQNLHNARNLMLQQDLPIKLEIPDSKEVTITYYLQKYKNLEDIFNLEKYFEVFKSHIPENAPFLDIVSYTSLFIANYFEYDYKKYKKIKKETKEDNIKNLNATEFIESGKGICRDYAGLTKYLLCHLGVDCTVLGTGVEFYQSHPDELGHAFNLVTMNGKNYFLDNTWLAESIRSKKINSLAESVDFLTSNKDFKHDIYQSILDNYCCETMDREEVRASLKRVASWTENYVIHKEALKDLFRKYLMRKQMPVENKIENAILNGRKK